MNGAESLLRTLHGAGVDVCFANPGTSEMQFVDALDRTRLMRCVLGLFEGVVTGAADGYSRMAGKPAITLLHLAPGLANAGANMHNAKKARSPMLNLVGDHSVRHLQYDAPLSADVATTAAPFSDWVRTATSAETIARDAAEGLAAASGKPGRVATLIVPADIGWDEGGVIADPIPAQPARNVDDDVLARAIGMLGKDCVMICGGSVLEDRDSMALLQGVADQTGAALMAPTSSRRTERGAGQVRIPRIPYPIDMALESLKPFRKAVLIETRPPVAFFAYPGRPSLILQPDCEVVQLADFDQNGILAIEAIADALGARPAKVTDAPPPVAPGAGRLTYASLAAAIAAAMPENAIVIDEGITCGRDIYPATTGSAPMSWLSLTGGAIGIGVPLAIGAAIASPDRPVIALQADGSAMYTIQGLWTQARESLNITTIVFANRSYEILKQQLYKVGTNPGPDALNLLDLTRPDLDFVSLAHGMGVPGMRVEDARELYRLIISAAAQPGPFLIEAVF